MGRGVGVLVLAVDRGDERELQPSAATSVSRPANNKASALTRSPLRLSTRFFACSAGRFMLSSKSVELKNWDNGSFYLNCEVCAFEIIG
jgi:hypothetical protein